MLRKMTLAVAVLAASLIAAQAVAVPLVPATIIRPVDATFSVPNYGSGVPARAINNSGLSSALNTGDLVPVVYPAHDNVGHPADSSLTDGSTTIFSMYFDLGAVYNLHQTASMHLWNYNENNGGIVRSVQNASIYYTSTGANIGSATGWTLATSNATFAQAPGVNTYTGSDYGYLNNLSARFVRFDVTSNYGDAFTGLSEIRFITAEVLPVPAPEPASIALLGLGCLGLIARRRRQLAS